MAKLIYSAITSLDGYVADGRWDWCAPDEEGAPRRQRDRAIGRHPSLRAPHVRGARRLGDHDTAGQGRAIQDFAQIWRAADKVVYSRTLESVSSALTRIERDFDPDAVRQMKRSAQRDISVGGPELAAQALTAALIDELHLSLSPVIVGGGHAALPDDARLNLELLKERRFANGVVHLRYRCDD